MDRNFDRSSTREKLPPLAPGRISLVSIKPKLGYEKTERNIPVSPTYLYGRCPPSPECFKRQRPVSGDSPTFLGDVKRQRPGSVHSPLSIDEDIERYTYSPDSNFSDEDIKRTVHSPILFGDDIKHQRSVSGDSPTFLGDIKRQRPGSVHSPLSIDEDIERYTYSPDSNFSDEDIKRTVHSPILIGDDIKRQRPVSGDSPTFLGEDIKRQRPGSAHSPILFGDDINHQRPISGKSPTFLREDVKRQRPGSVHSPLSTDEDMERYIYSLDSGFNTPEELTISGQACTIFDNKVTADNSASVMEVPQKSTKRSTLTKDGAVKSLSAQQIGNENTPTPNISSLSAESATKRPHTPTVNDAKAEKRRKRKERKEREARKLEEARLKEQEKLEKERQVEELSRNRSMFNGNKDTLPSIGRKYAEVNFYMGKMPEIEEVDLNQKALPKNNAVDVIQKHEAQVHTSAFLRKISHDYINASAQLMDAFPENEAIDIIEAHEEEVGRKHAATNHYVSGSYSSRSVCRSSSARSRCSSGVSRRVAV